MVLGMQSRCFQFTDGSAVGIRRIDWIDYRSNLFDCKKRLKQNKRLVREENKMKCFERSNIWLSQFGCLNLGISICPFN